MRPFLEPLRLNGRGGFPLFPPLTLSPLILYQLGKNKITLSSNSARTSSFQQPTRKDILTNERYIGDELFQKRYTTDTLPFQKKINRGQKKQYYAEDTHDPIISREVFRKAQELLKRKSERHGHQNNGQYTFTSLIVCDECGTNFCRRIAKNQRVLWTCRKHFKGKHLCSMQQPMQSVKSNLMIF